VQPYGREIEGNRCDPWCAKAVDFIKFVLAGEEMFGGDDEEDEDSQDEKCKPTTRRVKEFDATRKGLPRLIS
jgi:hypothetical protein